MTKSSFPKIHSDLIKTKEDLASLHNILDQSKSKYKKELTNVIHKPWYEIFLQRLVFILSFGIINKIRDSQLELESKKRSIQRRYYALFDEIEKEIIDIADSVKDVSSVEHQFIIELRSHICESGYPSNWEEIAREVRERDGYQCTDCKRYDQILHVHHIVALSGRGSNNLSNLTSLCEKCHIKRHPHMRK